MKYFIPAWHKQYDDWSINIPSIENYDAAEYMTVLKKFDEEIGLIITDYQPQLLSKLNQIAFFPNTLFSVYDFLQGVHGFENKVLELEDFNWPKNAIFDYGPFRTLIVLENQLYATVFYDIDGHILRISYPENDEHKAFTLGIDSRGFISNQDDEEKTIYFDPYGNWRFKKDKTTDKITVNLEMHFCKRREYENITDLVDEILSRYLKVNAKNNDEIIVTVDDESSFNNEIIEPYKPLYIINRHHPYSKKIGSLAKAKVIVSSNEIKQNLEKNYREQFDISVIPVFNSEFRLGHSQRQNVQEIGFFAENANDEDIHQIIQKLCNYILKNPDNYSLKIFTYNFWKADHVNKILEQIKEENKNSFILGKSEQAENAPIDGLDDEVSLPELDVAHTRLTNISDVLSNLDKMRLLINWGKADELMQISGVSIGIPQVQNFSSATVVDNKNGRIIKKISELLPVVDEYLTNLNSWNQTVVYNVQLMNQYSEENIIEKWKEVFKERKAE